MKTTLREIISDIEKIMMANFDSTKRINPSNLRYKIDRYRMDYLAKLLGESFSIPSEYFQQLSFDGIDERSISEETQMDEKIGVISGLHLADMGGLEILTATGKDRRTRIDYVTETYMYTLLGINDDSLKDVNYFCRVGSELHFSNGGNKSVILKVLSSNPISAAEAAGKTSAQAWEEENYPVDGQGLFYIIYSILTKDFNVQSGMIADIIEDGKDQFQTLSHAKPIKNIQPQQSAQ